MHPSPNLDGNLLKSMTRSVRRVVGFSLGEKDVQELYGSEVDLLAEIRAANGFCDTTIADVFARAMVDRDWPIAEEGDEVSEEFLKDLTAAAKECGWIPITHLA